LRELSIRKSISGKIRIKPIPFIGAFFLIIPMIEDVAIRGEQCLLQRLQHSGLNIEIYSPHIINNEIPQEVCLRSPILRRDHSEVAKNILIIMLKDKGLNILITPQAVLPSRI